MKKILIVEDDKFLSSAYRMKFKKTDFEVKVAMDGEEALRILALFTPDLILLDLVMPRKDGFALLEELRKNEKWAKIPVIVATNLEQKEDLEKAKGLGVTDYVIKSNSSIADIVAKINTVLEK